QGRAPNLAFVKAGPQPQSVELRLEPGRGTPGAGRRSRRQADRGGLRQRRHLPHVSLPGRLSPDRSGRPLPLGDAPPADFKVNVPKAGYQGIHLRAVPADSKEVAFTLTPSLQVAGRVRDAVTQ